MSRLLCAPDKFKATATARQIAEAAAKAATESGWSAEVLPLADGGEGLLDVVGGERRLTEVTGPLGRPVVAEWRLVTSAVPGCAPIAVIEMARASGLGLVGGKEHNDAINATTTGTGELVIAAIDAGAARVIVGCGGSATTDGGRGAIEVIGTTARRAGVPITVACDVSTDFCDAARVFGPQKGASAAAVEVLTRRLELLAAAYLDEFAVDVTALPRAGAAGGLAGGLAAIGAELVSGFDLVAGLVGLDDALRRADLVLSGEGRLDRTSLVGKVVGELSRRCARYRPLVVIVGEVAPEFDKEELSPSRVVALLDRFGRKRAMADPGGCVIELVREMLTRPGAT